MKRWLEPQSVAVPESIRDFVGGHSLIAEMICRRGFTELEAAQAFLDPEQYTPSPSSTLPDLFKTVDRLRRAIQKKERICVWGDFDVDGQTSTTLLVSALRNLGADVFYHIPVRETESHGINLWKLKEIIEDGFDVLLTCDTGVSEHEAVDYAKEHGVEVIITDHHELPPELPAAYAVINPMRLNENHPLRELPGVGVAYKLIEGLYDRYGFFEETEQFLDLVALGIVADVAVQTRDTRYLLQLGLEVLRNTGRLGLQELMKNAGIEPSTLSTEQIGFSIAPRMNALGRLGDANPIVDFLTTDDPARARGLANQLEALNAERKLLQDQVHNAALDQIERDPSLLDQNVLILHHESWPGGVLGLVASRLVDQYGRPAIVLTSPPGEPSRGSVRSILGVNITRAISDNEDLLLSFGGHAMAAGLSIETDCIPELRRALHNTIVEMVGEELPEPTLQIDGYVSFSDLSMDLVEDLDRLAPFGAGNPPIILATQSVVVLSESDLGKTGNHKQYIIEDEGGVSHRILRWKSADSSAPEGRFDLAFSLSVNEFRGKRELQLVWVDARQNDYTVLLPPSKPAVEVIDCRDEEDPESLLRELLAEHGVLVWGEGDAGIDNVRSRKDLKPSRTFVIWTLPPSSSVLRDALDSVEPERIFVFANEPGSSDLPSFLKRLAGLAKNKIKSASGNISYTDLAVATAQTDAVIRKGIAWLQAKGFLKVVREEDDFINAIAGSEENYHLSNEFNNDLQEMLLEVAAYRKYFLQADVESLVRFD